MGVGWRKETELYKFFPDVWNPTNLKHLVNDTTSNEDI